MAPSVPVSVALFGLRRLSRSLLLIFWFNLRASVRIRVLGVTQPITMLGARAGELLVSGTLELRKFSWAWRNWCVPCNLAPLLAAHSSAELRLAHVLSPAEVQTVGAGPRCLWKLARGVQYCPVSRGSAESGEQFVLHQEVESRGRPSCQAPGVDLGHTTAA